MNNDKEADAATMIAELRSTLASLKADSNTQVMEYVSHIEKELDSVASRAEEREAQSADGEQEGSATDVIVEIKRVAREVEELKNSVDQGEL